METGFSSKWVVSRITFNDILWSSVLFFGRGNRTQIILFRSPMEISMFVCSVNAIGGFITVPVPVQVPQRLAVWIFLLGRMIFGWPNKVKHWFLHVYKRKREC